MTGRTATSPRRRRFSGARLNQARVHAGMRKEELAYRSDCSHAALHSYELGRTVPGANVLARMADALAISIDDLFEVMSA